MTPVCVPIYCHVKLLSRSLFFFHTSSSFLVHSSVFSMEISEITEHLLITKLIKTSQNNYLIFILISFIYFFIFFYFPDQRPLNGRCCCCCSGNTTDDLSKCCQEQTENVTNVDICHTRLHAECEKCATNASETQNICIYSIP